MSSSEKKCFRTELARENTVPGKTGGNMDNSPRPLEGKVYFSDYNNCKLMHLQKERLL